MQPGQISLQSGGEDKPRHTLEREKLLRSRMVLSHPIMILSPVTNEPVYLWNVPGRCFRSILQLSQSFVAHVSAWLKIVAALKFRISIYVQKSMKL